ncbi:UDP-N-acetylmuramate--L-alanine ligase [Polluticoccus soli]|uniref:UDP-N-acetylmuramate--L-alanine ligase n=1 Tax=Polluticoccus soli TaxID=3034150 RepID=UPI0023E0BD69|nr:UDP-N-acetylmuramate--L-alanine ligase [Flavipsychrobacter sp. JY13-12]
MNVQELKRVYFVGIGGIGMSALARFFNERGAVVKGYDRTETELTKKLAEEGMEIHYTDDVALLDKEAELVVYTPAIPKEHTEFNWYKDNGYPVYKRSDVLQWISEKMFAVTVGGTHGKTTISTMTAYLLRETGYGCNAFLGGVSVNYGKNYWSSDNQTAVIEADEYDRSFLKLRPDIAVLTAMDADHLDIYGTVEELEKAFIQYTQNIKSGGTLLVKHGLEKAHALKAPNTITYSLQNDAAGVYAANIVQKEGGYIYDVIGSDWKIEGVRLPIGGMHNVENSVAAIAVTQLLEIDGEKVKAALAGFKGIKRRFEYIVKTEKMVYIDDYAHHPEELAALIASAKRLFPGRKCVVAFQPHLFSRTRDLADGFAHSLDMADEVILLDIYPARELPMEGVTSQMIAGRMGNPSHTILSKEGLLKYVEAAPLSLFITAGAGDIDKLVDPIKQILESK